MVTEIVLHKKGGEIHYAGCRIAEDLKPQHEPFILVLLFLSQRKPSTNMHAPHQGTHGRCISMTHSPGNVLTAVCTTSAHTTM